MESRPLRRRLLAELVAGLRVVWPILSGFFLMLFYFGQLPAGLFQSVLQAII